MILVLSPLLWPSPITVSRVGDVLTIEGEDFDLGPVQEGATLPADAIDSMWFGDVTRTNGVLTVTLRLPHSMNAPEATRFPAPMTLTTDGIVSLPPYSETV